MPIRPPAISTSLARKIATYAFRPLKATTRAHSTSTVHTGTIYESLVLQSLIPLAFNLTRVGGRSDRGIDLLGHWCPPAPSLPPSSLSPATSQGTSNPRLRIPAIVQCKAHISRPSPSWVRELSGAIPFAPLHLLEEDEKGEGVIGVLACKGALTLGIREALMRSERGLVWCQVPGDGRIGGMVWNRVVGEMVGGLGVGSVYRTGEDGRVEKEMRLMRDGKVWGIDEDRSQKKY